jgi:hypothetical protein
MYDAYDDDHFDEPGPPSVVGVMLRWLFGPAVFVGHLAIFLAAGVGMLAIDLIQDPTTIWATAVLRRWTVVVGVHALVATIGWAVALVIDASRAAEDEVDIDDTFWPPAIAPNPAPAPAEAVTVSIDWTDHIAPQVPATALPGSRLPTPGSPLRPTGETVVAPAVAAALEADSAVLEWSAPYDPPSAPANEDLPPPAPPEATVPAGAPPRARFSPPATAPAAPDPADERKPRWYDRHRKKDDVPTTAPDQPDRTPPGWRVITPESEPSPAAPLPPSPATTKPGDESWTWIEAAAQAWLEHRAEATGTTGRPAAKASDPSDPPAAASEDPTDEHR